MISVPPLKINSLPGEGQPNRSSRAASRRVYILLLNWNGWQDTIECLESVLRLSYPDYQVIVCDNASQDCSAEMIRRWACGQLRAYISNSDLSHLTEPPIPKPISIQELRVDSIEATEIDPKVQILLLHTGKNRGFAGGNNVALDHVLKRQDFEFVWLLNNDTVVDKDALSHLVDRMTEKPRAGICGSTLIYYHNSTRVQACGGSVYNRWLARGGHIGAAAALDNLPGTAEVEATLKYIVGASLLVRRSFLEQIGLMDEQYFLYFEEIDWATRAKSSFGLAYARDSKVYHKEGKSIGSTAKARTQSALAEFYLTRNRVLFTRKHYPFALPTVFSAIVASALDRAFHRRWENLLALCRGVLDGMRVPLSDTRD